MSAPQQLTAGASTAELVAPGGPRVRGRLATAAEAARERLSPWHGALALVVAGSAVLDLHRLRQNGFANIFYSAGVRSELHSLHNFLFVSFDPGGLISTDKPPLGMWVQVASAKLFDFSPMSLLVPEAVAGILGVLLVYRIVAKRFGAGAGVASAAVLATFPSFVAVARDNGPDPILILLMLAAAGAAVRASETGRLRWLLTGAVLVGLAFNTKTLAALLVVPGLALAYLVCAPNPARRRIVQLLVAGLVMAVVCGAWIAFVDLTPASQRPYVGGSTDNSEVNLTFDYNGFGRVGGQVGGPGSVPPVTPAAAAPVVAASSTSGSGVQPIPVHGRARHASEFAGATGPLRLFSLSLGGQDGWLLPFAGLGLIALALDARGRRDPRLAALIVLGGWSVAEAVVLSFSKGIVHPYYVAALAPGVAAVAGAGAFAMARLARRVDWRLAAGLALPVLGAVGTVGTQIVLLAREHYLHAFVPILAAGVAVGIAILLARPRWSGPAMALVLVALLVAPTAYASTLWQVPTNGTFPAAGPHAAYGPGGYGVSPTTLVTDVDLERWVRGHAPGTRWAVLTVASDTASPLILMGLPAGSLGGYGGTDPVTDGRGLARLVAAGEARYVLLGGAYADRGGNAATVAVGAACRHVPAVQWLGRFGARHAFVSLFDCAGRERQLQATPAA